MRDISKKRELIVKNRLREYMIKYHLIPSDLAYFVGSSTMTIRAIMEGKFVPSTYLALCIANFFDVDVSKIFYLEVREYERKSDVERPNTWSYVQSGFKRGSDKG